MSNAVISLLTPIREYYLFNGRYIGETQMIGTNYTVTGNATLTAHYGQLYGVL